jgi:hypothetical protein
MERLLRPGDITWGDMPGLNIILSSGKPESGNKSQFSSLIVCGYRLA